MATCDLEFLRCACIEPPGSLLRSDGFCEFVAVPKYECHPTYRASLAVVTVSSPELSEAHIRQRTAAESLVSATRSSLGHAVSRAPNEIAVLDAKIEAHKAPMDRFGPAAAQPYLAFDLFFSFCAGGSSSSMDIGHLGFESRFLSGMQRYVAFSNASMRFLYVDSLITTTLPFSPEPAEGNPFTGDSASQNDWRNDFGRYWWASWVLTAVVVVMFSGWCVLLRRKKHLAKVASGVTSEVSAVEHEFPLGQESLAVAMHPFDRDEICPQEDIATENELLALNIGDVLEVLLTYDSGWYYGRQLSSGLSGYFPGTRVAFAGTPCSHCVTQNQLQFVAAGASLSSHPTVSDQPPSAPLILDAPTEPSMHESPRRVYCIAGSRSDSIPRASPEQLDV